MLTRFRIGCVLALICAVSIGMSAKASSEAPVLQVKFGLEALSDEEQAALMDRLDAYALAEAVLGNCGKPTDAEKRMVEAIKDCIEPAAIEKVTQHFRQRLTRYKGDHKRLLCDKESGRLKELSDYIDKAINEAARLCKACLVC
jgi:hypothetical protein